MEDRRGFLKKSIGAVTLFAGHRLLVNEAGYKEGTLKAFDLKVAIEEDIYRYEPANNGASPMFGYGMTSVVRSGDDLFASGLETIPGVEGLSNCRWLLFKRYPSGWKLEVKDLINLTREPASLAIYDRETVLVSVNPKQADSCVEYCLTHPEILSFDRKNLHFPYQRLIPEWKNNPGFMDHSYRGFATDPKNKELILFQNYMYHHAEWSFLDRHGRWSASGSIKWPLEAYAGKEVPLRLCHSNTAIKDRKVSFFAAADVMEPVEEWKKYKMELTGEKQGEWVFRRLFFGWSDDITKGQFHPWVEIANRDKTGGNIYNRDLWLSPDGRAYLLWTEKAIDERLRDRFFPSEKQENAILCAIVENGKILRRITVLSSKEGDAETLVPGTARFHAKPDGRLFVIYYVSGSRADGSKISENRIIEIDKHGRIGKSVVVPLRKPFITFHTANERAGCEPSDWLDIVGGQENKTAMISFASVRII